MPDGRFRRLWEGDDVDPCICLSCKSNFGTSTGDTYTYCPHCGVKFKGEFSKKNTRYHRHHVVKDDYKTSKDGLFTTSKIPRLVIEDATWDVVEKSSYAFQRNKTYEVNLRWHSSTHCTLDSSPIPDGPYGTPVSPFSWMFFRYIREERDQNSRYHCVRLVLVTKKGRRVIREISRVVDKDALIAEQIRRDKMPRSSGVGSG